MLADQLIGFSCCAVAGVGFSVNYIPVKKMDTGDGVFFAAAMSLGIVVVGVITGFIMADSPGLALPKFEPLAALGGCIWMLGNLMCPYIIRLVGLGLGLTVWDLSNMITGWFTGFFGLFGVQREVVLRPDLNCLGVSLAAFSLLFFSLAANADRSDLHQQGTPSLDVVGEGPSIARSPTESTADSSTRDLEADEEGFGSSRTLDSIDEAKQAKHADYVAQEQAHCREIGVGILLAILAGTFFGTTFDLPTDLAEGDFGSNHSPKILNYVWSHFFGIFATAAFALVVYVAVMRRKSYMPKELLMPALATCFFGEMKSPRSRLYGLMGLLLRLPGVALIAVSI